MFYLVFDKDDELIDVLNFETLEELEKYKQVNPDMIVKEDKDFLFLETDDFTEEDY